MRQTTLTGEVAPQDPRGGGIPQGCGHFVNSPHLIDSNLTLSCKLKWVCAKFQTSLPPAGLGWICALIGRSLVHDLNSICGHALGGKREKDREGTYKEGGGGGEGVTAGVMYCITCIIGSAEALPILCVRCARWERERYRERRKGRHHFCAKIGDEFCTFPCQKFAP